MAKNALEFGGSENSSWKKGIATFKLHPNYKKNGKMKLIMEKESWTFRDNLLPKYPKEVESDQEYFVEIRLDDDGMLDEIQNIRPSKWMGLKMMAVDMTRPDREKVEPPAPYSYTANYSGKEVEETAFYIFYKCIDEESDFYGVLFPNRYFYKFKNDGAGMAMWDGDYGNPKATRLHRVVDHLSMLGAVSEPLAWPEDGNVLPELLARIKAAGVVVETAGGGKYASISEMMESKQPVKAPDPTPVPEDEEEKPSVEDDWDENEWDEDDF